MIISVFYTRIKRRGTICCSPFKQNYSHSQRMEFPPVTFTNMHSIMSRRKIPNWKNFSSKMSAFLWVSFACFTIISYSPSFKTGIEFRDAAYLLSPKNTRTLRKNMILNLSLGFTGLTDQSGKQSVSFFTFDTLCLSSVHHLDILLI